MTWLRHILAALAPHIELGVEFNEIYDVMDEVIA